MSINPEKCMASYTMEFYGPTQDIRTAYAALDSALQKRRFKEPRVKGELPYKQSKIYGEQHSGTPTSASLIIDRAGVEAAGHTRLHFHFTMNENNMTAPIFTSGELQDTLALAKQSASSLEELVVKK